MTLPPKWEPEEPEFDAGRDKLKAVLAFFFAIGAVTILPSVVWFLFKVLLVAANGGRM